MNPDKSLSTIFDPRSPSPQLPSSPAPAYSILPYRDVEFFAAPLLDNKIGDIELETTDGKRFLVHRKLLEAETVFFHIYYGFVPVWELQDSAASNVSNTNSALNNLLCLPKILVNHLSRNSNIHHESPNSTLSTVPTISMGPATVAPPVPPKDANSDQLRPAVTAPTPTTSAYTWLVPEDSQVLLALLHLLYPPSTFLPIYNGDHDDLDPPETPIPSYAASQSTSSIQYQLLTNLDMTSRVIRASLGYQCTKTLNLSRDHLMTFLPDQSIQVYALATFFRFNDLAKLASYHAIGVPDSEYPRESLSLMGRSGLARLKDLQRSRMEGLVDILETRLVVSERWMDHWEGCVRRPMAERLWGSTVDRVKRGLKLDSDLVELITAIDVRGGHCGECLMVIGENVGRCVEQVKKLPKTV